MEELKQRVIAKKAKINRYDQRIKQFQQNRMFRTSQKQFYQQINGEVRQNDITPDAEESRLFWSDIWDNPKEHNQNAEWLENVKRETVVTPQNQMTITTEAVKKRVKQIPNWKCPGPDGVAGYWIKSLSRLHERIAEQLNEIVQEPWKMPAWMTYRRTLLCLKDRAKGAAVDNFRQISCLPLMWKLTTAIISDMMYDHLDGANLLPCEQKGCRRKIRGTKDQLLIDKLVLKDSKKRRVNLAVAWIDYRKAYDMIPHSWIKECMEIYGIADNIRKFITSSMETWKTKLTANGSDLADVNIRRGIFQGDSLSPLLFVICMIPLTKILQKCREGYEFKGKQLKINHLLFMDDLKLFGKDERQVDSLVKTVHTFSADIGMEFGIKKCGVLVMKGGKVHSSEGISLPGGEVMKEVEIEGYKYLGIMEYDKIKEKEVKENFVKEYFRRIKLVLKSKLNGNNKISAINTWAVSLMRYGGGILNWRKDELEKVDRKTRKLMTMYGMLHPKSNVARIYVPRRSGGRGLISCENCIRAEENSIGDYIRNSIEPFLKKVAEEKIIETETCMKKEEWKKKVNEKAIGEWKEKVMHGQFLRDLPEGTDVKQTFAWMGKMDIKPETEALICAAQEQALRTNYVKFNIDKTAESPLCRMCKSKGEFVGHIISECPKLAQKEYKRRHDNVARIIHWELCGKYQLERAEKWYEHKPEGVIENEEVKLLWDFNIQVDHTDIEHRRPDIVVVNKKLRKCELIDIAVPGDIRILSKEGDKIDAYTDLKNELFKLWSMKEIEIVPIIVGTLGAVSTKLETYIQKLGIPTKVELVQKTALLGTARILRKVLQYQNE